MSFDVGDSFNQFADAVCRAPVVGSVLSSPIWAALLLTAVAAVIVLAVYHGSVTSTLRGPGASRAIRAFIYVFGAVAIITALHYRATVASVGATATRVGFRDVVGAAEAARAAGSEYPVESITGAARVPVPVPTLGGRATDWQPNEPVPNLVREYGGQPTAPAAPAAPAAHGPHGPPAAPAAHGPAAWALTTAPGAQGGMAADAGPGVPSVGFALPRLTVPRV